MPNRFTFDTSDSVTSSTYSAEYEDSFSDVSTASATDMYATARLPLPRDRHPDYRYMSREDSEDFFDPSDSQVEVANLARKVREKAFQQRFVSQSASFKARKKEKDPEAREKARERLRVLRARQAQLDSLPSSRTREQERARLTTPRTGRADPFARDIFRQDTPESARIESPQPASPVKRGIKFIMDTVVPYFALSDGLEVSKGHSLAPTGSFSNAPGAYPSSFVAPTSSFSVPALSAVPSLIADDSDSSDGSFSSRRLGRTETLYIPNSDELSSSSTSFSEEMAALARQETPDIFVASESFIAAQQAAGAASNAHHARNAEIRWEIDRMLAKERARVASAILWAQSPEQKAKWKAHDERSRAPKVCFANEAWAAKLRTENEDHARETMTIQQSVCDEQEIPEEQAVSDEHDEFDKQNLKELEERRKKRNALREERRQAREAVDEQHNPKESTSEASTDPESTNDKDDVSSTIPGDSPKPEKSRARRAQGDRGGGWKSRKRTTSHYHYHPYSAAGFGRARFSRDNRFFTTSPDPIPSSVGTDTEPPVLVPVDFLQEVFDRYERLWKRLSSSSPTSRALSFASVPWPLLTPPNSPEDITPQDVRAFLFRARRARTGAARRCAARKELLRWHPDKFAVRVLARVHDPKERERVQAAADVVSKVLTDLI